MESPKIMIDTYHWLIVNGKEHMSLEPISVQLSSVIAEDSIEPYNYMRHMDFILNRPLNTPMHYRISFENRQYRVHTIVDIISSGDSNYKFIVDDCGKYSEDMIHWTVSVFHHILGIPNSFTEHMSAIVKMHVTDRIG